MIPTRLIRELRREEEQHERDCQGPQKLFDATINRLPLDGALKRLLQKVAAKRGIPLTQLCRDVLAEFIERESAELPQWPATDTKQGNAG